MSRPCPDHGMLIKHGITQCPKCMRFITQPICKRCQKPFEPRWLKELRKQSECCIDCSYRNLMDGLDLPTPPEYLDRHTKHPTLTQEEYKKEVSKPSDDVDWSEAFSENDEL